MTTEFWYKEWKIKTVDCRWPGDKTTVFVRLINTEARVNIELIMKPRGKKNNKICSINRAFIWKSSKKEKKRKKEQTWIHINLSKPIDRFRVSLLSLRCLLTPDEDSASSRLSVQLNWTWTCFYSGVAWRTKINGKNTFPYKRIEIPHTPNHPLNVSVTNNSIAPLTKDGILIIIARVLHLCVLICVVRDIYWTEQVSVELLLSLWAVRLDHFKISHKILINK